MGYFYPPPPVFIGGRQPYAPPLGIVQSGPVPQAPPQRGAIALATLGILISSWQPTFQQAQGAGDIAPILQIAAVSGPPPMQRAALYSVLAAWQQDPTTVISLPSAAGNIAATPDQPPAVSRVNLDTIRRSWEQPFQMVWPAEIAPLVAPAVSSQPPAPGSINLWRVLASWQPEPVTLARRPFVTFSGATPDQPQPLGRINLDIIRRSWDAPFQLAQGAGDIAPLIPAATADQPPVPSGINLLTVIRSWTPAFAYPQAAGNSAPFLPAPAAPTPPPIQTYTMLYRLRASWEPPFQMPAVAATVAAVIPPPEPLTPITCAGGTFDSLTPMTGLMI